jgi:hypothetical protein
VHLTGIAEFFFDGHRCRGLNELAEPRPGIGEPPGRQLDAEGVQSAKNAIAKVWLHITVSYSTFASKSPVVPPRQMMNEFCVAVLLSGRNTRPMLTPCLSDALDQI